MKPAPFALITAGSVEEALAVLADETGDVKPLAGGQSLVPLLNFRLARPEVLVDLNHLPELSYIRTVGDGITIGAMCRQRSVERSESVREVAPLLGEAVRYVAHPPIRNRGTVGGSLAHADPAAELCTVMLALNATVVVRREGGQREISVHDLFVAPLTTSLRSDELLVEIKVPVQPRGGWAFEEVSRRRGDFAIVGVAVVMALDDEGMVGEARLAYASMGPTPMRAHQAEVALRGQEPRGEVFAEVARTAVSELEARDDLHATGKYRAHVAEALTYRALTTALDRAKGGRVEAASASDGIPS